MEANTISKRIQFLMKDLGYSSQRMCRLMGLDPDQFEEKLSKNTFEDDELTKLCDNISEIRYTWLVIGAGSPYSQKPKNRDLYDYKSINEFVTKVRKENDLTQAEFYEIMGVARTTQSAIERHQQTITIGYMRRLHQKFKVPYHTIIDQLEDDVDMMEEMFKMKQTVEKYKKILSKLGADDSILNAR